MKVSIKSLTVKLDRLWSAVTGREHQFCVRLGFLPKGWKGQTITMVVLPSASCRPGGPEFYRAMRKHYGPAFMKKIRKAGVSLNNGSLFIDSISYLGRF